MLVELFSKHSIWRFPAIREQCFLSDQRVPECTAACSSPSGLWTQKVKPERRFQNHRDLNDSLKKSWTEQERWEWKNKFVWWKSSYWKYWLMKHDRRRTVGGVRDDRMKLLLKEKRNRIRNQLEQTLVEDGLSVSPPLFGEPSERH